MAERTKGYCKFCGKEYAKAGMIKHLNTCKEKTTGHLKENVRNGAGVYRLIISAKYNKDYWMIIDINADATLQDLDMFIRDIWVECCGHLSCFEIDGFTYEDEPEDDMWGEPSESTEVKLSKVLDVGMNFKYEYDFGSTTELVIRVADYKKDVLGKEKITILSRNNPIQFICGRCRTKPAKWFNPEIMYYGSGEYAFLCDECIDYFEKDDEYDEELGMYLPVCNSPRMGVCGYGGSKKYGDQFVPDIDDVKIIL